MSSSDVASTKHRGQKQAPSSGDFDAIRIGLHQRLRGRSPRSAVKSLYAAGWFVWPIIARGRGRS